MGNVTQIEMLDDSEFEQTIALREKITENLRNLAGSKKIKMAKSKFLSQK